MVSQLLPSPKYQDLCPENSKHIERKDEGSASANNQQANVSQSLSKPMQHVLCPVSSKQPFIPTCPKDQDITGPWSLNWLSQKPICEGGNVFTSSSKIRVNKTFRGVKVI